MAMSNLQARFPQRPVYSMAGLELVLNYGKQRVGALCARVVAAETPREHVSDAPPWCRPLALSVDRLALAVVV
jgi:hypothetical protein